MPSMTWVSTFGLTAACGNRPLSDLSTFNEATGGAGRFSPSLSANVVVAGGGVAVVVVLVVFVMVPPADEAIDEMLTVTVDVDEVIAAIADGAEDTGTAVDVVTVAPVNAFDGVSVVFGEGFTFDATECVCDTLVEVAFSRSAKQIDLN